MPNYPKYDPYHSSERASHLFGLCGVENLFGTETQNGKDIDSWAPKGDWLDKSIAFFTPTEEERHSDIDLYNQKIAISSGLESLKSIYSTLGAFSRGTPPENAEEKWNQMMADIGIYASLADKLMEFNSRTQNKYISEPAMKAAFGVAHGFGSMRYAMEELEAQNRIGEFSDFPHSYNAETTALKNLMDQHVKDCTKLNAAAAEISRQRVSAENADGFLADYIKEYEKKAAELDKEIDADLGDNLEAMKLARAEAQLTGVQLASLELKHTEEQIKTSENKINSLEQTLKNQDLLSTEDRQLIAVRDMLKSDNVDKNELLRTFLKATGGDFTLDGESYSSEDTRETMKFKNQELEDLKKDIEFYIDDRIGEETINPDELRDQLKAERKTLDGLKKQEAAQKVLHDTLKAEFMSKPAPKGLKADETDFDYDKKTADQKIEELKTRLSDQEKALEEKERTMSANPELYKERKNLSRQLKEAAKQTAFARNTIGKDYIQPIKALENNGKELKDRITALNSKTKEAQLTVRHMRDENPLEGVRERMAEFSRQLGQNKRPLHKDSTEFKALKSLVDSYAQGAADVTLTQIKAAAETYLGEKEKQRVNANSSMRNYRKSIASMIRDYSDEKIQKDQFHKANSGKLDSYTIDVCQLDSNMSFNGYCSEKQNNTEAMKASFNSKINRTAAAAMEAHQNIEEAISTYNKNKELLSPQKDNLQKSTEKAGASKGFAK